MKGELEGMESLRMGDMEKLKGRCLTAEADVTDKEETLRTKQAELEAHKTRQLSESGEPLAEEPALDGLRESLEDATTHLDATQAQIRSLSEERDADVQRTPMSPWLQLESVTSGPVPWT